MRFEHTFRLRGLGPTRVARFCVLGWSLKGEESILGTADGEHRYCPGVFSLGFEIPKEPVSEALLHGLVKTLSRLGKRFSPVSQRAYVAHRQGIGVSGLGSAKLFPNLTNALAAEPHFDSQLAILSGPIHLGPLGQERIALELAG